jgi:hypothetical protein
MPPRPAVPSVMQIVFNLTYGEDVHVLNRFFMQFTPGGFSQAQANALASSISTFWNNRLAPIHPTNVTLTSVVVTDLTSSLGLVGVSTTNHVGTRAGGLLSAETAVVLQFHTLRRYRGGHPRMYLPAGVAGDLADTQTWVAGFATVVAADWIAMLNDIQALVGPPSMGAQVSVSYYQGFTPVRYPSGRYRNVPNLRAVPVIDTPIAWSVNPKIGSQRRRALQSR